MSRKGIVGWLNVIVPPNNYHETFRDGLFVHILNKDPERELVLTHGRSSVRWRWRKRARPKPDKNEAFDLDRLDAMGTDA